MNGIQIILLVVIVVVGLIIIGLIVTGKRNRKMGSVRRQEKDYIDETCMYLKEAIQNLADERQRARIERVYDIVRSSQLRSKGEVSTLEAGAVESARNLSNAVAGGDPAEISACIEEVERIVRMRNNRV